MDRTTKRTAKYLLCSVLILCVGMAAGVIYFFDSIFPKAGPVNLPEIEDIISVSIGCSTLDMTIPMNANDIEEVFKYLSEGEPTRQQAMDDHPVEKLYYAVLVLTAEREYCYFIYEKGGQVYIEVPYEGIYKTQAALLDLALAYY